LSFDLPRNTILAVDAVDVGLDPGPHPFEAANHAAIDANWRAETAANPALFDGTVVLLSSLSYRDRRLVGRCHAIRYASFLYWRRHRDTSRAEHSFAHAVLVARDNALVAVRMGAHTANPGRVYFAAGSFEPVDFRDGRVDLHANMAREVGEETGIDLANGPRDRDCHFISIAAGTVIFRRYFLDEDGETIAAKVRAFVAAEREPEIDGPIVIRHAGDLPEGLAPQMKPIIDWHFSQPPK
jgi:8-oxo-dGTP pyrophosphatase MutT (NUDIX family)